ncbi:MAG: S-layer homology domain-containing protein [Patescibacteria group bacterium]
MEAIFKYRDGAGPAAAEEFFTGDKVRVLVNSEEVVLAAQNAELLLCDQNFYGWARDADEEKFNLETVEGDFYEVLIGKTTQFRDEDSKILFGYSPREDDVVKIHGVVNTNVRKIFTETFGAYISLLAEDALAPFLAEIEAKKAEVAAALAEKLAKQIFSDVPPENEFFFAVNFVANEGIVSGYEDGNFQPEGEINRAEFTKILVGAKFAEEIELLTPQISGESESTESCFPDFAANDWFAKFVCFARANEILGGYPDGNFKPANPVNLAEAITILVKSFGFSVDANTEGEWFEPFLEKAEQLEILPEDFPAADENITRGQMSELVMRALKYSRGELVDYLEGLGEGESGE